ncbi:MAG: ATP-binding protein [Paenisporosarcina sp.]
MRAYIEELIQIIQTNLKNEDASFLRLDHFSHPFIYLQIAKFIKAKYPDIIVQLSKERYVEFCDLKSFHEVLVELSNGGFVSDQQRLTKWRNTFAEEKKTIILLGTESVQDKGGLADFYSITPKDLEANLAGNYAKWFKQSISLEDKKACNSINHLFEAIFKHLPSDLLIISQIAEDVNSLDLLGEDEVCRYISENLWHYFHLPNIKTLDTATISGLTKNNKFKLLDSAVSFIKRDEYRSGFSSSKEKKLKEKFNHFQTEKTDLLLQYDNEINSKFGSYEQLKEKVLSFSKGINSEALREELSTFDYYILSLILGVRVPTEKKSNNVTKIKGQPLHAYSEMIIDCLQRARELKELVPESTILIDVRKISLAEGILEEDKNQRWQELCIAVGGLLNYLNVELESDLTVKYKDDNEIFSLENSLDPRISFTSTQVKVSKIAFSLIIEGIEKMDYEWSFNPYDFFLQSFAYFPILENQIKDKGGAVVPVFAIDQIGNLLTSTDTESFHFMLKSHEIEVYNALDILKKLQQNSDFLFPKLLRLVEPFSKFVFEVTNKGFYHAINVRVSDVTTQFIQKYIEVITETYKAIPQMSKLEKDHLFLISNLFTLLSKESIYATVEEVDGAIIPPYHPAMLEKIVAQQAFQRKGIAENIEYLLDGNKVIGNSLKRKFEKIAKQSTIISGVDTILSKESLSRIPSQVLGYYALHGKNNSTTIIDSSSLLDIESFYEEDENIDSTSSKAILIKDHIQQYVNTFPSNIDGLSICFVNFEHLQPVIEGLREFINNHKNSLRGVNLKLHILSPTNNYKAKNYMRLWLNNNFSEDDNVNIQAFFNELNNNDVLGIKNVLKDSEFDLVFIESLLVAKDIVYEPTGEKMITPGETKFPMVFHPMPTSKDEKVRNVSISQKQFEASFAHSQLAYWIKYPNSKEEIYRVEKVLGLGPNTKDMLKLFHESAHWVVSIDTGLDKSVFEKENIISFSTGEGAFGELNVAISASTAMREDILLRLKNRLKALFSSWDMEMCQESAQYCLAQSTTLDGIKVLKALNPRDYEIHSFLSSILAMKSLNIELHEEDTILKSFISMDSYNHWFTGEPNRPDFLLLEIKKDGLNNDTLQINVKIIECKMGKENVLHVEKGLEQLQNGYKFLQRVFNEDSIEYDRRYWYAQLYRLLAFSPIYLTSNEIDKDLLNTSLLKILDGNFHINWDMTLLTYWLDHNHEEIDQRQVQLNGLSQNATHASFGQLYIQKELLPERDQSKVEFVSPTSEAFELFADDEQSFIEIREERKKEMEWQGEVEDIKTRNVNKIPVTPMISMPTPKENKVGSAAAEKAEDYKLDGVNPIKNEHDPSLISEKNVSENKVTDLESIRVLLGEEVRTGRKVYWEYGHPKLENRHILISGKSGVGKTYFMQCLLLELAQNNISSIIFDYTDGFKKSKLEPEFKDCLGERINQFHVQKQGFPVNPFKKNMKEIDEDEFMEESEIDVAERIKSVFSAVYSGMGDQQANAIYRATLNGLKKYGDHMSLDYLRAELELDNTSNAKTVLAKIEPLIDRQPFNTEETYNWEEHRTKEGIVFVVQLSGFVREVQLIVTEFILWDLWNFNLSHGDKNKPFPVILDEAQNLDHSEKSPSAKILTEGRKFGWSGWYATQFMQGQLAKDEIRRMQNASQKIYFSPPESEINDMASFLSTDSSERKEWANKLSKIGKGQCVVSGPMLRENGELQYVKPSIIDVTPLRERV